MSFTPEPFSPSSALEILHGSPRVQGSNQLQLDGGFQLTGSDPTSQYFIGVAAGPIVMLVVFVVWLIALCCVGCCRRKVSCGNKPAIILFVGFMVLSCFGWFYSIGGNAQTTGGVDKVFNLGDELNEFVDSAESDVIAGLDTATNLVTQVGLVNTTCNSITGLPPGAAFDFLGDIAGPMQGLSDAVISDIRPALDDAVAQLREVTGSYNDVVDDAEPFLRQWQLAYEVLVGCIITLTLIFTLATIWRVWEGAPGQNSAFARCLGKSSSWLFYTVGILLLLLIWIVIALLAAISTVGADLCLPSPAENILRVLDQVTAEDRGPGAGPLCEEVPYSYACYYTTCNGTNPVEDIRDEIDGFVDTGLLDTLNEIRVNLTNAIALIIGPPNPGLDACALGVDGLIGNATLIPDRITDALGILGCERIQPLYAGLVEDGLCNGVAAGMGVTWITMALAASSMMCALFVYRLFEFDKYRNGQLMTADVIPEGGTMNPKLV